MAVDKDLTQLDAVTPQLSDAYYAYVGKAAGLLDKKVLVGQAAGKDTSFFATAAQGATADAAAGLVTAEAVARAAADSTLTTAAAAAQTTADAAIPATDKGFAAGKILVQPTGLVVPTTAALATAVNLGSATIVNKNYGVLTNLTPNLAGSPNKMTGWVTAVLSGDWSITGGFKVDCTADNDNCFGLFLTDGTKGELFTLKANLGGSVQYAFANTSVHRWDNRNDINGAGSADHVEIFQQIARAAPHFLRVVKSGTTRTYYVSATGLTWTAVYSKTTDQTETLVGIGGRINSPNTVTYLRNSAYCFHFENTLSAATDIDFPPY